MYPINVASHAYFIPVSEKNEKIHREKKKNVRDAKQERKERRGGGGWLRRARRKKRNRKGTAK